MEDRISPRHGIGIVGRVGINTPLSDCLVGEGTIDMGYDLPGMS
jgi:hypothetical protein